MKKLLRNIIIFLFLLQILLFFSNCQFNKQSNIFPRNLEINSPPDDLPPDELQLLEQQKEQLESDYKKKLEENSKLKKQIEKKIKYIKILLTTGISMLSIIIYFSIKIYMKYSRQKSIQNEIKKLRIKNSKNNNENKYKGKLNISSSNSSIEKSNDNLLKSNSDINMSNNNNEDISEVNNNQNNNFNKNLEEENNYDAAQIVDCSNIVINDDNKTLTNNPDFFVPSRMDRILYKPYPKEEINRV